MLDTINLERKGIPAAVVGLDKLLVTTGKGMARAQGYPTLEFASFPYSAEEWAGAASQEDLKARAESVASQVERILLGRT